MILGYSCKEISSKRSRMSSGSQVNAKASSLVIYCTGSGSRVTEVFSSCMRADRNIIGSQSRNENNRDQYLFLRE